MNFSVFENDETLGQREIWESYGGSASGRGSGYQDRQGYISNLNYDDWSFDRGSIDPGEFIPYEGARTAVPLTEAEIIYSTTTVPADKSQVTSGKTALQTIAPPKNDDDDDDDRWDVNLLVIGAGIIIGGILLLKD